MLTAELFLPMFAFSIYVQEPLLVLVPPPRLRAWYAVRHFDIRRLDLHG